MKILFDIRKGTGGRTYSYSLIIQAVMLVDGEKMCFGDKIGLYGIPAPLINSVIKEFQETGCLTGTNLAVVKNGLHNKRRHERITVEELNAKYAEY